MTSKTSDPIVTKSILDKTVKASEKRLKKEIEVNSKILEFDFNSRMDEKFQQAEELAQKRHSQIFDLVDGLAGEIKASREERVISGSRISNNTQKINKLEKKVFGSIQVS